MYQAPKVLLTYLHAVHEYTFSHGQQQPCEMFISSLWRTLVLFMVSIKEQ